MKKLDRLFISLLAVGLLAFTGMVSLAQAPDRGDAKATIGTANVTINYGRPSLKGRDPPKMLQPGQVWRMGSNASTTIESNVELDFGGTRVAKGKHILLAHLAEPGKWTLVVSSKPYNQYDPRAKLAGVPMELKEAADSVEQVTIQLASKDGKGIIEVAWGKLRLTASFAAAK